MQQPWTATFSEKSALSLVQFKRTCSQIRKTHLDEEPGHLHLVLDERVLDGRGLVGALGEDEVAHARVGRGQQLLDEHEDLCPIGRRVGPAGQDGDERVLVRVERLAQLGVGAAGEVVVRRRQVVLLHALIVTL